MPADERLTWILEAKDKFSRVHDKANKSFAGIEKKAIAVGQRLMAVGAVAGVAGGAMIKSFIDAGNTTDQYRLRLNALLGSVEEGNRLFADMADFAGAVPFEYEKIMSSATQLAGVMKGGVEEVNKWMPLIADLSAVSGLGIEKTTEQVIRMYSAGAASADLFRERGILSMLGFQAGVSVSAEATRKKLISEWEKTGSKFNGASQKLAETWEGKVSMLNDAWFQFKDNVAKSGLMDVALESLGELMAKIKELKDNGKLDEWAKDIAEGTKSAKDNFIKIAEVLDKVFPDGSMGAMLVGATALMLKLGKRMSALAVIGTKMYESLSQGARDNKQVTFEQWQEFSALEKVMFEAGVLVRGQSEILAYFNERQKSVRAGTDGLLDSYMNIGNYLPSLSGAYERLTGAMFQQMGGRDATPSVLDVMPQGDDGEGEVETERNKANAIAEAKKEAFFNYLTYQKAGIEQAVMDAQSADEFEREMLERRRVLLEEDAELEIERRDFLLEDQFNRLSETEQAVATWISNIQPLSQAIAGEITKTFDTVSNGIGNAMANAIVYGKSIGKAMKEMGQQVAASIIKMLTSIMAQKAIAWLAEKLGLVSTGAIAMAKGLSEVYVNSFASASAIPLYGWAIAPAVASANLAMATAGAVGAKSAGAGLGGAFHGGMDYVPKETSYLLDKGERVLSPNQNSDLTSFLSGGGGGGGGNITVHIFENATNPEAMLAISANEWIDIANDKIIPALQTMTSRGVNI